MTDDDRSEEDSPQVLTVPYNHEAEEALISAALEAMTAAEVVATKTTPADYYVPRHRRLAAAITEVWERGEKPDPVTVGHVFNRTGWPAHMTQDDLWELAEHIGWRHSSAPTYATIVHDLATARRLMAYGEELTATARKGGDVHELVQRAQQGLAGVASQNGDRAYSGLEVADVGALLDAGLKPIEADFLTRTDGRRLLYAGRLHTISAEPSVGKTWVAGAACVEVLDVGGAVLYLDFEDVAVGIVGRLVALGLAGEVIRDRFRYAQIVGGFGPSEKTELFALVEALNPDLVVIDGVAEALARDGFDENSASDFVQWKEALAAPLARTGAAVVMLDHVKKDDAGRWGRGTGAKLGAIDGAAYMLKLVTSYSRRRAGAVKLTIAKDRPGGVGAIGETAAVMHIEPHADGARVVTRFEADTGQLTAGDSWKPTVLMTKLSEELLRHEKPVLARTLKSLIHSERPRLLEEAIARLEAEGYIARTKLGRSIAYTSLRPYPGDGGKPLGHPQAVLELDDGEDHDDPPPEPTSLEEWKDRNF